MIHATSSTTSTTTGNSSDSEMQKDVVLSCLETPLFSVWLQNTMITTVAFYSAPGNWSKQVNLCFGASDVHKQTCATLKSCYVYVLGHMKRCGH